MVLAARRTLAWDERSIFTILMRVEDLGGRVEITDWMLEMLRERRMRRAGEWVWSVVTRVLPMDRGEMPVITTVMFQLAMMVRMAGEG